MRARWIAICSFVLVPLVTSTAFAVDFSQADALFKRRGEGLHTASAAKNALDAKAQYQAMLDSLSGADLLYAMGRMGELYLYLGNMVTDKNDKTQRLNYFGECENAMERIHPSKVGENPVYYYFKGACAAFYAESGNTFDKIARLDYFKKGKSKDTIYSAIDKGFQTYLEGGVYRVGAGVFSNQLANLVGLYKPEEAVSMMVAAVALPADTTGRTGEDYCENHRYLAQSYLALKTADKVRAGAALNHAIEYFAASRTDGVVKADYMPDGVEAETQVCLEWIYQMKDANNL